MVAKMPVRTGASVGTGVGAGDGAGDRVGSGVYVSFGVILLCDVDTNCMFGVFIEIKVA